MALKLITAPTNLPITLAEAKEHLKVDFSDDDTFITTLINAAVEYFQNRSGRQIVAAIYENYFNDFPSNASFEIWLEKSPVQTVTSILYNDNDGAQQTLAATEYESDKISNPATIRATEAGDGYPGTDQTYNNVIINYTAGFGLDDVGATGVDQEIKTIIKQIVAHFYENRDLSFENAQVKFPMQIGWLIDDYKIKDFV